MDVTPETWRRLEDAFARARVLAPSARAEFLDEVRRDDEDLAREVATLLDSESAAGEGFLEPATAPERSASGVPEGLRRIGNCALGRFLGEGGMGAVYEAVQHPVGRPVAVKILKSGLFAPEAGPRFEHEIRLLARLRHPGIAQVYEAGRFEDAATGRPLPYFVMELISGAEPVTLAADRLGLDMEARLRLFLEIADAVAHAHARGVIHRDLKPGNILVGTDGCPRVIDFGVARIDESAGPGNREFRTSAGALVGTLPYMSPEQLGPAANDVDVRADVYGLGVVLYELLSGKRPHDLDGLGLDEAIRRIREEPAVPAGRRVAALAGDAEAVLGRALETDRARRYASVADFAGDVRRLVRGEPVLARPASSWRRIRASARSHRAAFVAAAIVLVVLISATVVSAVFAFRAEDARRREATHADDARKAGTRAEALFTEGRQLANWTIHELQHELERLAGSMPVRRKLTERILAYLQGLERSGGDDSALATDVAKAYEQVGRVASDPGSPNRGDPAAALAAHERAIGIYERMAAREPDAPEHRRNMAVAGMRVAMLIANHGDARDALRRAEASVRTFETLHAGRPSDRLAARDLAKARQDLARVLEFVDDPGAAKLAYEEALALYAGLAAAHPDDPLLVRDLAGIHHDLGFLCLRRGETGEARAAFVRLLEASREAARDPANARAEADVANALFGLGDCDFAENDTQAALGRFREAEAIYVRRSAADPGDVEATRHLAMTRIRTAEALAVQGEADAALAVVGAAIRSMESLPEGIANDGRGLRDRRAAWTARGNIAHRFGRTGDAADAWLKAAETGDALVQAGIAGLADRTQLVRQWRDAASATVASAEGSDTETLLSALGEARDLCRRALAALPEPADARAAESVAATRAEIERFAAGCARRAARLEHDR